MAVVTLPDHPCIVQFLTNSTRIFAAEKNPNPLLYFFLNYLLFMWSITCDQMSLFAAAAAPTSWRWSLVSDLSKRRWSLWAPMHLGRRSTFRNYRLFSSPDPQSEQGGVTQTIKTNITLNMIESNNWYKKLQIVLRLTSKVWQLPLNLGIRMNSRKKRVKIVWRFLIACCQLE